MCNQKDINSDKMFAYFGPDGKIIFFTIAPTLKMSRSLLIQWENGKLDTEYYEKQGYKAKQILLSVIVL